MREVIEVVDKIWIVCGYLRSVAEGMGFEPTVACATHAFQACSFDRSDTPLSERGAIITESF